MQALTEWFEGGQNVRVVSSCQGYSCTAQCGVNQNGLPCNMGDGVCNVYTLPTETATEPRGYNMSPPPPGTPEAPPSWEMHGSGGGDDDDNSNQSSNNNNNNNNQGANQQQSESWNQARFQAGQMRLRLPSSPVPFTTLHSTAWHRCLTSMSNHLPQVTSYEPSLDSQQQANLQGAIQQAQQPQSAPASPTPQPSQLFGGVPSSWLHRRLLEVQGGAERRAA